MRRTIIGARLTRAIFTAPVTVVRFRVLAPSFVLVHSRARILSPRGSSRDRRARSFRVGLCVDRTCALLLERCAIADASSTHASFASARRVRCVDVFAPSFGSIIIRERVRKTRCGTGNGRAMKRFLGVTRARWTLPLPYFDGFCEATTTPKDSRPARCARAAVCVRDGHAVCSHHRCVAELTGMDVDAAAFRFGQPITDGARLRARWDWE